MKVAHR